MYRSFGSTMPERSKSLRLQLLMAAQSELSQKFAKNAKSRKSTPSGHIKSPDVEFCRKMKQLVGDENFQLTK